ncbi:ARID DNA-binding domain-containing protein [Tanacetum coccineum]
MVERDIGVAPHDSVNTTSDDVNVENIKDVSLNNEDNDSENDVEDDDNKTVTFMTIKNVEEREDLTEDELAFCVAFDISLRGQIKRSGASDVLDSRVHYAPEITLNVLSINLLKQQGFGIIFEGDRCTLKYMFKNQQGRNMDVDRMRQKHNDYLDNYFESLEINERERQERGQCQIIARAPENPIRGGEDSKGLEEYQWNIGKKGAQIAVEKGKEKLEHFVIKLEEEEDCKQQQTAYYGKEMTCYKCQDLGHYAFECP